MAHQKSSLTTSTTVGPIIRKGLGKCSEPSANHSLLAFKTAKLKTLGSRRAGDDENRGRFPRGQHLHMTEGS